ncbi:unnamed protein product [Malus baccata var. baccata]
MVASSVVVAFVWPLKVVYVLTLISFFMLNRQLHADATLSAETQKLIDEANQSGPYLGLLVCVCVYLIYVYNYLIYFVFVVFKGRRFRFGSIANKNVILINGGITSQLLLSLVDIEGVVLYGIEGNPARIQIHANSSLNIADVVIPQYWAHTSLWSWQRYGKGPEDDLPLEANGDYTREFGYLKFADYTVNVSSSSYDNLLNNIWYQLEEDLKLEGCLISTTCLSHAPKVARVERGTSASIYLDNAAYRDFIYNEFNVSPVDMETASVALICLQQIRALSDLAGGGSADSNEANTFITLAANNSVTAVLEFIKQLS